MTIWVTSDQHFGHKLMLKHRPFEDVKEMNQILVKRWNERVQPEDIVYHLGDFALVDKKTLDHIVQSLNGRKILIRGNHDGHGLFYYLKHFTAVLDSAVYQDVLLSHAPQYTHEYKCNLHGHIHHQTVAELHPTLWNKDRFFNVNADLNAFYPHNLHKILERVCN